MTVRSDFFAYPGVVAVTGHRLNKMNKRVRQDLFTLCRESFGNAHPDCALLSCLADGSDIIAARAWPSANRLLSLLPVPVDVWKAILAQSTDPGEFQALLKRTQPEILSHATRADYDALATALVARCDRVLAIWDGAPGLPGGTGSVVARAREAGKPVLHLLLRDHRLHWN